MCFHLQSTLSPQEKVTEESIQRLKQRFMSAYDVTADGKLQIQEVQPSEFMPSFTSLLFGNFLTKYYASQKNLLIQNEWTGESKLLNSTVYSTRCWKGYL